MQALYKVCVLHTNKDCFDYEGGLYSPAIGARVWVPFRNQKRLGIVVGKGLPEKEGATIKAIDSLIDKEALIDESMLTLCTWVASYYQSPLSEVLPLALPKKYRLGQACELATSDSYELALPLDEALQKIASRAKKQQALLAFLDKQASAVSKQCLTKNGFHSGLLLPLLHQGILAVSQSIQLPYPGSTNLSPALALNPEQAVAVQSILAHLKEYQCFLLQGVTGSGKTEVYLQVIAEVLQQGKQVLVLVPEIGLTPQLLARFTQRFAEPMAVMHSNLNDSQRQQAWQLAKENQVQLIIGTRSSVFTPMPNLGLIIIDEEHDASLKQMEGVRYSARDTALMRAHQLQIPIILGSATPSLESLYNCQQDKYTRLSLTQKALSTTPLHYQLLDLRSQTLQQGLSEASLAAIETHLNNNNQVLVFINRRGFAPVVLCHQCGWMADCKACDSHLTLHKKLEKMLCHHCGLQQKMPVYCGNCKSSELIPLGAGTQRVQEFLSKRFPNRQVIRIDRDQVSKKNALEVQLEKINSGEAQLIVGTQMLAKGHHFPRLTLVVVLDADAGLYNQDFRAVEHLGQLLTQVAGRAGRADQAGQVLIQTHLPDHPLLNLLLQEGYDAFAQALLQSRQRSELPPYHYLAVIRAQGKNQSQLLRFMHAAKDQIILNPLAVMGPAPAPLARKANQHRMQLLVKSPTRRALKQGLSQLRDWLLFNKLGNGIRWNVDVDPMDLS